MTQRSKRKNTPKNRLYWCATRMPYSISRWWSAKMLTGSTFSWNETSTSFAGTIEATGTRVLGCLTFWRRPRLKETVNECWLAVLSCYSWKAKLGSMDGRSAASLRVIWVKSTTNWFRLCLLTGAWMSFRIWWLPEQKAKRQSLFTNSSFVAGNAKMDITSLWLQTATRFWPVTRPTTQSTNSSPRWPASPRQSAQSTTVSLTIVFSFRVYTS